MEGTAWSSPSSSPPHRHHSPHRRLAFGSRLILSIVVSFIPSHDHHPCRFCWLSPSHTHSRSNINDVTSSSHRHRHHPNIFFQISPRCSILLLIQLETCSRLDLIRSDPGFTGSKWKHYREAVSIFAFLFIFWRRKSGSKTFSAVWEMTRLYSYAERGS